MFDLFKQKKNNQPKDVKTIRQGLLKFIKEQLQRYEGGEGSTVRGLQLYLSPAAEEKELYETAVYAHEAGKFQSEEVQKIADDYALDLPEGWTMDLVFSAELPAEAIRANDFPVSLHVATNKQPLLHKPRQGYITILKGEAEQKEYTLSAQKAKVYIGRDHAAQTPDGFLRENTIAFPGNSEDDSNKYISRQHAHIEWNAEAGCFFIYADEGGIPPRNKVKVHTTAGNVIKLQTIEIGHPLGEGDQVVLGEKALLGFSYTPQQ